MKVLGLDASTSVVGVCVLDENKNILLLSHVDLTKCDSFWEKCDVIEQKLREIIESEKPDVVIIEEAVKKFTPGASSANTISLLLRWNGIVSYLVYKILSKAPEYVSANEARKLVGIKVLSKKKSGLSQKEQTFNWCISGPLSAISLPKTKTGSWKPYVFDMADAYVLACAGVVQTKAVQTA